MKSILALLGLIALATAASLSHYPSSDDMISYINSLEDNTWQAGHNDYFKGKDLDYARRLCGVIKGPNTPRLPRKTFDFRVDKIPATFDSRKHWSHCPTIKEIRDQSACGSCWAFGAVEAISDRYCIASKGSMKPHISAEDLNSCCESCGDGCEGGFPSAAWNWWVETGIVTGGEYKSKKGCLPYSLPKCDHHTKGKYQPCGDVVPTPPCKQKCEAGYNKTYTEDKLRGSKAYSVGPDVAAIQTEIMTFGPVEATFDVYEDFLSYKSGVYQHKTGQYLGGHAVKMLGWGKEGGTLYWLMANSWNEDWGAKGYFKILRGSDECGIEDGIDAGTPIV